MVQVRGKFLSEQGVGNDRVGAIYADEEPKISAVLLPVILNGGNDA